MTDQQLTVTRFLLPRLESCQGGCENEELVQLHVMNWSKFAAFGKSTERIAVDPPATCCKAGRYSAAEANQQRTGRVTEQRELQIRSVAE